jgi:hypothetical protein
MPTQVVREEAFSPAEHLQDLLRAKGQCVSIFLPLNGSQEGANLFRTRTKAALKRAGQLIVDTFGSETKSTWPPPELARFAEQLRRGRQRGGIAIFSCDGQSHVLHANKDWDESIHVGEEYYIRPLLSLLMEPPAFHLLTLNEQDRRLLVCTREGAEEMPLPAGVPESLEEALLFKQPDHRLEHGSASGPMPGDQRGVRFGTSADEEKHDIYLRQLFLRMDASLRPLLMLHQYPLMLAGVKRQLALYESVNTYPHLLRQHVECSSKWLSSADLYELAEQSWKTYQAAAEQDILKEIDDADQQARVIKDALELLPAVDSGKVHHLVISEQQFGDATDEMMNHLAIVTLRKKGRVSVCKNQSLPAGSAVGILRYGRESRHKQAKAS